MTLLRDKFKPSRMQPSGNQSQKNGVREFQKMLGPTNWSSRSREHWRQTSSEFHYSAVVRRSFIIVASNLSAFINVCLWVHTKTAWAWFILPMSTAWRKDYECRTDISLPQIQSWVQFGISKSLQTNFGPMNVIELLPQCSIRGECFRGSTAVKNLGASRLIVDEVEMYVTDHMFCGSSCCKWWTVRGQVITIRLPPNMYQYVRAD